LKCSMFALQMIVKSVLEYGSQLQWVHKHRNSIKEPTKRKASGLHQLRGLPNPGVIRERFALSDCRKRAEGSSLSC
jgi:hypothetical protein